MLGALKDREDIGNPPSGEKRGDGVVRVLLMTSRILQPRPKETDPLLVQQEPQARLGFVETVFAENQLTRKQHLALRFSISFKLGTRLFHAQ